jgi:hypothetical protein
VEEMVETEDTEGEDDIIIKSHNIHLQKLRKTVPIVVDVSVAVD